MSRNVVLLLVLGVVIFAVAFSPLALTSFRVPSNTFSVTTVDGLRIVYDVTMRPDASKDAPLVVLLHGFSGNRVMMRMIALALADKGFICASVDLRGFGSSEGLMGSLEDFDKDVKAVVWSMQVMGLGDTSRIVLIGHSLGGGVCLELGSQLTSVVAVVGVAPVSSPDWVNATTPRNLLLIISTGDAIINSSVVKQTFYKSVNGTLSFNEPHDINGANRELFVVDGPNHLDILYNGVAIGEIVNWTTRNVLGAEQTLSINPFFINVEVYLSLVGGTIVIISVLWLIHGIVWREKQESEANPKTDGKGLVKNGLIAILFSGILGSLVAMLAAFALSLATALFFTNFVTALFFGGSVMLAVLARVRLKSSNKDFSYFRLVKGSIRKPSLVVDVCLGVVGVITFMLLLHFTMGSFTSLTFSTSSMRLISLPLYTLIFAVVFVFYESFFKGFVRSLMGSGVKRMLCSTTFEFIVLFSAFVLELVVTATILSLFMPFVRLDFFVLGLNLVLIPLMISIVSAEVFYEKTGGWFAQIIVSALIFATLTLVFTPALHLF